MAIYSLDDVRAEYDRLDQICGVDTTGVELKVSTRGVNRYGCCEYGSKNGKVYPRRIMITDFIMDCESEFINTIRHEYAHALAAIRTGKSHGHDAYWKKLCIEVGCRPERICLDKEAGEKSESRREQLARYEVFCCDCHSRWKYVRAGNVVKALQKGKKCTCLCGSRGLILFDYEKEGIGKFAGKPKTNRKTKRRKKSRSKKL